MSEITLQINLSAGDIDYAELTLPKLVAAHRERVNSVIAVVDCCRPQKTQCINPEINFPSRLFEERVTEIRRIAESLRFRGYIDKIHYLESGDPKLVALYERYTSNIVSSTHDNWGCGLVSYLAGLDFVKTRYILHYDADMLLASPVSQDWTDEALSIMKRSTMAISASPWTSPPDSRSIAQAKESPEFVGEESDHFKISWFSTRCFLLDLEKLRSHLPLIQGRFKVETLVRRITQKSFPPSPEIMMYRRLKPLGFYRADLKCTKSWLLHPVEKSDRFLRLLPIISDCLSKGIVPEEQVGFENLRLDVWQKFADCHFGADRTIPS